MDGRPDDADPASLVQKTVVEFGGSQHTPSDIERLLRPEALEHARSLARRFPSGAPPNPQETALGELWALGWFHWYRFLLLPEGRGQGDLEQSLNWFSSVFPHAPEAVPEPVRDHFQEERDPAGSSAAGEATAMAIEHYDAYERTGETTHINAAIEFFREAAAATPAGHSDRARRLFNLGAALQARFDLGEAVGDVDEAIVVGREAVAATLAGDPDRARRLSNLGATLQVRFDRDGTAGDLDEAIVVGREAVEATPTVHPDRAGLLSNLGFALRRRFDLVGAVGDVDEAIVVGREAVEATPFGHPDHARRLSNLGTVLRRRFERVGLVGDVDEAIVVGREAVEATPVGHADRAMYLSNLGIALRARFERGGVVGDVDEAIVVGREAVEATPVGHADRAMYLSNLGIALQVRFGWGGVVGDLDEAIVVGREAVEATPVGHADRAMYLSNLGLALQARSEWGGVVGDMDDAIVVAREAVEATHAAHPDRAGLLSNLGTALRRRAERSGAVGDLDEAIVVAREALAATPAGRPDRGGRLSNLGTALRMRFAWGGAVGDLEEAIVVGREAVTATMAGDPDRGGSLFNLGAALRMRFAWGGAVGDLEEAIVVGREAVEAAPVGHPDRAMYLSNLGTTLLRRFEGVGLVGDVDEAIVVGREAVEATLAGHPDRANTLSNLGMALHRRFERGGAVDDLEEAIVVGREAVEATLAGHPASATYLSNLGSALLRRFERGGAVRDLDEAKERFRAAADVELATPSLRVQAYRRLGDVQRLTGERPEMVAASLRRAVVLRSEEVAPRTLDWQDQERLLGENSGLAPDAIAVHLDANDLYGALEVAELGRAVLLSYATEDRSDLTALRELDRDLADAFETALRDLNAPPGLTLTDSQNAMTDASSELASLITWTQHRKQADAQRRRLLSHIRSLPGMDSFLGTPPAQTLLDSLPVEGHVVLVNVSDLHCDALLCSRGSQPVPVALTELTASDVRDQVIDLLNAMYDPRPLTGQKRRQRVIGEVRAWLWDTTVAPILAHLPPTGRPPRVWWVPTGLMAALPLHAAAPRSGPGALELTVPSYAPNFRSLTGPHQASDPGPGRLLIASLPQTPAIPAVGRRPARPVARDLPGTVAEAEVLRGPGLLPPGLIVDDLPGVHAGVGAVTDSLRKATWAHFACHADADPTQPSNGRLLLYDGDLTIPELARLRLNHAQLAYLSACSTAVGGLRQADEVITVATAFRIAGFRHVIGTLWPLGDDIAPVAAKLFYETLNQLLQAELDPDDDCYARALHHTVTELRNQGFKPHQWAQLVHLGP
jgi:tetratricopeptide (TPR) repeat protein